MRLPLDFSYIHTLTVSIFNLNSTYLTELTFMKTGKVTKNLLLLGLLVAASMLVNCSKCYECNRPTSSSSSTRGACFDTVREAKSWKRDMEDGGYDCRMVPEDSF